MKTHLLLFFIFLFISNSCSSRKYHQHTEVYGIKDVLTKEILAVCNDADGRVLRSAKDKPIVIVAFTREDNICYVYIIPLPFVNKAKVKGNVLINDKLVAFYYEDSTCIFGLIDLNKMKVKYSLDKYIDESDYLKNSSYDAEGLKFRITSAGKLKLVHKGMF